MKTREYVSQKEYDELFRKLQALESENKRLRAVINVMALALQRGQQCQSVEQQENKSKKEI